MEEAGHRDPAPAPLALVQAFVNSADLEGGTDELASAEATAAWLDGQDLHLGAEIDEPGRVRLIAVREALRDLLEAHTGGDGAEKASRRLDRLLGGLALRPVLGTTGATLEPSGRGVDRLLGRLAADVVVACDNGIWERLKVCRSDRCRWAFYDHSKNGRGSWCTMRVCGSRAKSRAYRARARSASAPDAAQ